MRWISPTESGVHAGERLVQQHQAGPGGQCPGDFAAPPLAAGQAGAQLLGDVADLQFVQQRGQFLLDAGLVQVLAQFQHQADVVGHAQLAEHRGFLRQVAHAQLGALVHRLGGDVLAVQFDLAGIGGDQADDHVEAGGLAGAVRPQQADHFAGFQAQPEIADDLALAIGLAQPLCGQHHLVPCGCAVFGLITVRTRVPSPPLSMLPVLVL